MTANDGIAQIYVKDIHKNWKNLYATWLPNEPLELGDYGSLDKNGFFQRKGNIIRDGFLSTSLFTNISSSASDYKYSSKGCRSTQLKSGVEGVINQVANTKASMEITFEQEGSVFFNAIGCLSQSVENIAQMTEEIILFYKQGHWRGNDVIVTKLIKAQSATIIISSSNKSSIILEAGVDTPNIDLANTNLKLSVKSEQDIGFQAITKSNIVPLFGCHRLHLTWLGVPEDLEELSISMNADDEPYEEDLDKIRELLIQGGQLLSDQFKLELLELGEEKEF